MVWPSKKWERSQEREERRRRADALLAYWILVWMIWFEEGRIHEDGDP